MRASGLLWELSSIYRALVISMRFAHLSLIVDRFLIRFTLSIVWSKLPLLGRSAPSRGRAVAALIENMGPTYIKFGQILSMRPELPLSVRKELRKLQESVPSFSFKEAKNIIEKELKRPIDEVFSSFEKKPIAAASLAQVHRAVLKKEQVEVAVKVQRPNLKEIVQVDLRVLEITTRTMERLMPRIKPYGISGMVTIFVAALRREMDFELEASSQQKIAAHFAKRGESLPDLGNTVIPEVHWRYTARRVLTMEYIHATPFYQAMEDARSRGDDVSDKMLTLARIYAEMVFEIGSFHADPHPGNIYLTDDGDFVLFDFGMVEYVDDRTLQSLADLLLGALFYGDAKVTADAIAGLHIGKREDVRYNSMLNELRMIFEKHIVRDEATQAVARMKRVEGLLDDIVAAAPRFGHIVFPGSVVMFVKFLGYMDSLAREVSVKRKFDVVPIFQPYLERVLVARSKDNKSTTVAPESLDAGNNPLQGA